MRWMFLSLGLLIFTGLFSQEGILRLFGRMENKGSMIADVEIEVIKDNQIIREGKTNQNGSYKLDLELGAVYNIAFQKEGYITKQIGVVGVHPEKKLTNTYTFQLDLELFTVEEGEGDDTMLPPVAKLYIENVDEGFIYDKQYVKWVADEFDKVEE